MLVCDLGGRISQSSAREEAGRHVVRTGKQPRGEVRRVESGRLMRAPSWRGVLQPLSNFQAASPHTSSQGHSSRAAPRLLTQCDNGCLCLPEGANSAREFAVWWWVTTYGLQVSKLRVEG